ncbi:uncharacterized protein LOC126249235 [Schistocerca nitens]|uniref:uncharacterized protein LOC126249235 n=1 Tax=Schistocerca nitens TaxID=7011 RepID=UPI002117926B|nr:uncharacterized protein LOC126249235 [Schistocerca nitens]
MAMGNINSVWTLLVVLTTCKSGDLAAQRVELCEREKYLPCLNMARPLLTQAHLVFPDNKRDIDEMCKTWLRFEECINDYTKDCFTENQQEEFKKAVESPVDLVHRMCTEHQYQQEYLQQAACIQSTITREGHCSPHYKRLLDQVMGENEPGHLCCFHNQFRECVLSETKRNCGSAADPESAVEFSQQILDKALNFLHVQCSKYPLNPENCLPPPTVPMDNLARTNNYSPINELVHQQRSTDDMMSSKWQSTAGSSYVPSTWTAQFPASTHSPSPFHRQTPGQSWPPLPSSQPPPPTDWPASPAAAAAAEAAPTAWLPSASTASAPHQLGLEHAAVGAGFGFGGQPDNGAAAPTPAAAAASALLAAALVLRL